MHLDSLNLGGAEDDEILSAEAGYEHLLVLVENISGFCDWSPRSPVRQEERRVRWFDGVRYSGRRRCGIVMLPPKSRMG